MESTTTSISNLPVSSQTLNNSQNTNQMINQIPNLNNQNNIVLTKNEVISQSNTQMLNPQMQNPQMQNPQMQNPQMQNPQISAQNIENPPNVNYNELIGQLQSATDAGVTSLPTRDIPINPSMVNNDAEIKPNYIPQSTNNEDYIRNFQTQENLLSDNAKYTSHIDSLDAFYNEFQLPLLVSVLYFLFQLPIFKKNIKKLFPLLFNPDANPNFYGHLFNSSLFAIVFYILVKIINNISIKI